MIESLGIAIANADPAGMFGILIMTSMIGRVFMRKVGK